MPSERAAMLKSLEACFNAIARAIVQRHPSVASSEVAMMARRWVEFLVARQACTILGIPRTLSNLLARNLPTNHGITIDDIDSGAIQNVEDHLHREIAGPQHFDRTIELLGQLHQQLIEIDVSTDHRGEVVFRRSLRSRRKGGVYYTPRFVVDYIVKNTLEFWLDGKTPEQVAKLRVLDPACGTGFFLCAAYRTLLNWSMKNATKPSLCQSDREPEVSRLQRRLAVLKANVFGADIDGDAVRLTRFALVLEAWRDMSYCTKFSEVAAANVLTNIVEGDSLSGRAFDMRHSETLSPTAELIDGAIHWRRAFPQVAAARGFDIVIGNPPYRRELDNKSQFGAAESHLGQRIRTARMDLWYYFLHRGLELLKPNGTLSFITPAYWTNGTSARRIVEELAASVHINEIFHLGKSKVFERVSGQHTILRLTKSSGDGMTRIRVVTDSAAGTAEPYLNGSKPVQEFSKTKQQLFRGTQLDLQPPCDDLLRRIGRGLPLGELGIVRQGIAENPATINKKTNDRFGDRWQTGQGVFSLTPNEFTKLSLPREEQAIVRNYHGLCDLGRYFIALNPSRRLIYSTRKTCPAIDAFPTLRGHLDQFRCIMQERRETRNGQNSWWHLHWPRDEAIWNSPKIVSIQMGRRPQFVVAAEPACVPFSTNVWIPNDREAHNLYFVAAILNSRLAWKWFQHHAKRRGIGLEINGGTLARFPIPAVKSRRARSIANELARLSVARHALSNRDPGAPNGVPGSENETEQLERQIDRDVYDLYELDESGIETVEAATVW